MKDRLMRQMIYLVRSIDLASDMKRFDISVSLMTWEYLGCVSDQLARIDRSSTHQVFVAEFGADARRGRR